MQLGRLFYAGRQEKLSKNCTARFSGFREVLKISSIKLCHLFFSLQQNTTHTFGVGKFCYQRSQNLCRRRRRFRQLCALSGQVCECVPRLSYITTLSYMPGFTPRRFFCYHPPPSLLLGLVLLSISRLFLAGRRPLALLQVVVYLFAFSWTRHTINTIPTSSSRLGSRTGILGTTAKPPHSCGC